jgi:hypothetical protein
VAPAPRPPGQPVAVDVAVLTALGQLIAADAVVFNDLAPRRRSFWAEASSLPEPDEPGDPDGDQVFYRHFWSASCSHPDRSGDRESVTTLSDFSTLRAWRRSPMYLKYVRADLPFDRELLLPLPGPPGHSRRVRFIRQRGRDFDDTDRALATLLRPHLVAHLHALDLTSRGITPLSLRQANGVIMRQRHSESLGDRRNGPGPLAAAGDDANTRTAQHGAHSLIGDAADPQHWP